MQKVTISSTEFSEERRGSGSVETESGIQVMLSWNILNFLQYSAGTSQSRVSDLLLSGVDVQLNVGLEKIPPKPLFRPNRIASIMLLLFISWQ